MLQHRDLIIAVLVLATASTGHAATNGVFSVSSYIVGKGKCTIATPNTLNFGNLNGFDPVTVQQAVVVEVSCVGIGSSAATFVVDYTNPAVPRTLKHTSPSSANVIPYSLNLPLSGTAVKNNTTSYLTITGTILANDYKFAPIGGYTDTISIQVNP